MKYHQQKITTLLSELKASLALLKDISKMDYSSFRSDAHRISSSKYNLIVAIESIIDICNHIISKNSLRVPEDYADTFKVMAENDLITKDFAVNLSEMARFRNRLVHLYWKIDNDKIFMILKDNLSDIEKFIKALQNMLDK